MLQIDSMMQAALGFVAEEVVSSQPLVSYPRFSYCVELPPFCTGL